MTVVFMLIACVGIHFPLTIILYLGEHHLGLSVRPGEAEGASGCGQVGGVWRELGLDSGTRLLPDPP